MARLKSLRVVVIVLLSLLAFQFELGVAVNLSPALQAVPPLAGSISAVWGALHAVGSVATTLAAVSGVLFTLSGFKDDGDSHGMATNFLLSFTLSFVQLCILSVKIRRQPAP